MTIRYVSNNHFDQWMVCSVSLTKWLVDYGFIFVVPSLFVALKFFQERIMYTLQFIVVSLIQI